MIKFRVLKRGYNTLQFIRGGDISYVFTKFGTRLQRGHGSTEDFISYKEAIHLKQIQLIDQ